MPTITVPTDKLIIPLDGYSTLNWGGAAGVISGSNGGLAVMFIPQENFTLTNIIFF